MKHQNVASAIVLGCVIAGFSMPAHALNVSTQGRGQVLIYPYYAVNNGQDTYVSLANATSQPTVARVRFLEGRAGRPALDVDVHLSAYDSWSATVSQISDAGGARLTTSDTSCTRPTIPAAGLAFTASGYDGSGSIPADSGPHDITRTREGFIEVIGSGSVPYDSFPPHNTLPFEVPPIDCATIFSSIASHLGAAYLLTGSAAIIKVTDGVYYPYEPTAIDNFTGNVLYSGTMSPLLPSLQQASLGEVQGGNTVAHFFADSTGAANPAQPYAIEFENGIDAVSAVLMADSLQNDYIIEPGLGANTDWVITFPTRRFYDDPIYPGYNDGANSGAGLFVRYDVAFYDAEGTRLTVGEETFRAPYSTNIVSFLRDPAPGARSGVFGSALNENFAPTANSGMMRVDVGGHRTTASGMNFHSFPCGNGCGIYGSPLIGFMAYNIVNANAAPGKLANFGGTFTHHTTACTGETYLDPGICNR